MGKTRKKKIGIMGGTFDPIHIGHLVAAEEALNQFDLDHVIFIPSGHPPHKSSNRYLDGEMRYIMTVIATASNHDFSVSRIEIERDGPSYTIDTVEFLLRVYGQNTAFYFITGADAIMEILTWKDPQRLLEECYFIAATRPGFCLKKLEEALPDYERGKTDSERRVFIMEVPALAISSSDIRDRVADSRPVRYLLPEGVAEFINKNRFYK